MNPEQIEKNRKTLNIDKDFVFDFIEELGLWIIGGYGIIDIYEDGIHFKQLSDTDLPEGANIFLSYLTECDAAEGINVYKFNAPYLFMGDIEETDIYFIKCVNNGTTYFACEVFTLLWLFTLSANEKLQNSRPNAINELFRIDDSFTIDYVVLSKQDNIGLWLISNDNYESVNSWPSQAQWGKSYDLDNYAEIMLPYLSKINKPRDLKSVCYFKIPFWDGGHVIWEESIISIKLSDDIMCFASSNQDALRSFVINENEMLVANNDWKKAHPYEVNKSKIDEVQYKNQTIINYTTINGDFVIEKKVNQEVGYVASNGIGINNNK